MEFYEVVDRRETIRDFTGEPIDPEVLKRILGAGLRAPTNDHLRDWQFIVLTDPKVKARVLARIPNIPRNAPSETLDALMTGWRFDDDCQQKMYDCGVPKQYRMLFEAGCMMIPLFRQKSELMRPQTLSSLNGFASIWCCIENIFLAATAEGLDCTLRIPLGDEAAYVADVLGIPTEYAMPCYIGIGNPPADAGHVVQKERKLNDLLHFDRW